jgi:hypothetical protein
MRVSTFPIISLGRYIRTIPKVDWTSRDFQHSESAICSSRVIQGWNIRLTRTCRLLICQDNRIIFHTVLLWAGAVYIYMFRWLGLDVVPHDFQHYLPGNVKVNLCGWNVRHYIPG